MQISRISGATVEFAVRNTDADRWMPLSSLGVQAATTAEVIAESESIRSALAGSSGAGSIDGDAPLECPVVAPSKMLAIGLNYLDHIRETGATRPERPVVFAKYTNSLAGPTQDTVHDPGLTSQLDYESELAVIIGTQARRLTPENALDCVFGYAVANDVSARDLQRSDAQFSRSKSFDTFCPIGPWITTADEVADPQRLAIGSTVNGEQRQDSSTEHMLFSVRELLVFLSTTMTLFPGDVILTGTPPGVGLGFKPPRFLGVGDVVECSIEGLGSIRNAVVLDPAS